MVAVALQAGLLTYNGLVAAANELLSRMSKRHGEARIFREKMQNAKNYEVGSFVRKNVYKRASLCCTRVWAIIFSLSCTRAPKVLVLYSGGRCSFGRVGLAESGGGGGGG